MTLKLAAWLDRSDWLHDKDAADLATALLWYAESEPVIERLYADNGIEILTHYDLDPDRASAHLLGRDVFDLIGSERHRELVERWPGKRDDLLPTAMTRAMERTWPAASRRQLACLNAFEHGLGLPATQV